jgi:sulfate adenylyltransferase subunit 1
MNDKEKNNPAPGYLDMELLRFTTAGSVDDGKSTLIGKLLYDSKSIFEDQMDAVKAASERRGDEHVNLALLTDGLRAEREQGITIDVAYRYFATPKRKFIIADTPGHIQYTRNMVTGASTANLAIILVDARHGVLEQTIRHAYIASLLRIPHVVICINKMDLVDYKEEVYEKIKKDFSKFSVKLDTLDVRFIPISALKGDNVVERYENMDWYEGPTLLYLLENIHIASDINLMDGRFPVQYVIRPQSKEYHDYRGYAGRIASGILKVGDSVKVLPSGFTSKIKSIDTMTGSLESAYAPMSVTLTLEDDIDVSRGDMIVLDNKEPEVSQDIDMMMCWLSEKPLQLNGKYTLRHTTNDVRCIIKEVPYKVNINNL